MITILGLIMTNAIMFGQSLNNGSIGLMVLSLLGLVLTVYQFVTKSEYVIEEYTV